MDVHVGRGKHTALVGLCNKVWHDQEPEPPGPYDSVSHLGWYENYCSYTDRPNSKITNCLQECFGLNYDASIGRYEMRLNATARNAASDYLKGIGCTTNDKGKYNAVILHYEGNTSSGKKNLKHWQAKQIIECALASGRVPVVLDWDGRSPFPDDHRVFCPRVGNGNSICDIWGNFGSGDAAVIAALAYQAEAFIGIDSGPGKCASCTETPTLICWKALHPIQFHDPAPNTTHLVPHNWRSVPPCEHDGVATYFRDHYKFETYNGEIGLAYQAKQWLSKVLNCPMPEANPGERKFVLPNGIGDCIWALHKIKSIAADKPIDIILAGNPGREIDQRSLPFLKRFPWIRSVEVMDVPHLRDEDHKTDQQGRYNYMPDGAQGDFHYLMPNGVLERGTRLEEWLPDHPTDWSVVDTFDWSNTERGRYLAEALDPFVAFYLGPESGNVDEGHNRGFMWEPRHWNGLGQMLIHRGYKIAVVGAPYDRSYWERYVKEGVLQEGMKWIDLIGQLEIGETLAFLRRAKVFVSYQCGLAIMTHYFGGRVVTWWRPDGNSCHPEKMVAFDERMKDAWTNPAYKHNYMGLVYERQSVSEIVAEMGRREWL